MVHCPGQQWQMKKSGVWFCQLTIVRFLGAQGTSERAPTPGQRVLGLRRKRGVSLADHSGPSKIVDY